MPSYSQYKRQMACLDADDDIETWITVRGNHIPIMKGQTKEQAVEAFIESVEKKGGTTIVKKSDAKYGKRVSPEMHEKMMASRKSAPADDIKRLCEKYGVSDKNYLLEKIARKYEFHSDNPEWQEEHRQDYLKAQKLLSQETPTEKKSSTTNNAEGVKDRLRTAIKAQFGSSIKSYGFGFSGKFEETREDNGDITLSIRNLGDWEVSDDDRNDPDYEGEDFEDWDWEVPTEETRTKIKNIVESIKKETGRNVSVEFGEKNWTYFTIEGGKDA